MNAERAREAQAAMEAAQAEAERFRKEADQAREIRSEARRAAEAAQQEALRREQLAEEENGRAVEAQRVAEEAARLAAAEARAAREGKEVERQLREGIQPVVMPSTADLEAAKRRIQYRDGLYHFAVAGIAGSGKSSLINALRGLRNRDAGAAATGVTETTLSVDRFPDSDWYDFSPCSRTAPETTPMMPLEPPP
ncbi:hypothetical protein C8R47DRAFT_1215714 [Mycena vitilis]|nr:hypothetical protein C8R47DRAFT_1215714 [Mycena vitilis]